MDAHILLPRSMRPGSRDRSEQAEPQRAGPGPGHRGAPPAAVLANITQIGVFMATIDAVDNVRTEGNNATSPFFYDVLRDFLSSDAAERMVKS